MSLIKNPSMIYSSYKVKLFMKRYIICNNWQRKSFIEPWTLYIEPFHTVIKVPIIVYKMFQLQHHATANFWDFMISRYWSVFLAKIKQNESGSVSFSEWKRMLRDGYTLLVTCKDNIDINSSFDTVWRQLLQITWFFNMVVSISCAWGDSQLNSSNTQDMISLASWCWNKSKSFFPDLTITFCVQRKNWDGSKAASIDFGINIVLTKDEANGGRVSLCKEKIVHNCTVELKLCNEALM